MTKCEYCGGDIDVLSGFCTGQKKNIRYRFLPTKRNSVEGVHVPRYFFFDFFSIISHFFGSPYGWFHISDHNFLFLPLPLPLIFL